MSLSVASQGLSSTLISEEVYVNVGGSCVSGCTDSTANNYNGSAVIDDGTCTYDDPTGCTDSNATNYDPAAVVDDGSCTYPDGNMLEFVWTNGGGSWDSEASWAMANSSGTTVADSTVDLSLAAAYYGDDCYTLTGFDAWGDGWEGSSVSVVDGAGTTVVSLSVASQGLSSTLISEAVYVNVGGSCVSGCTDSTASNYNASAVIDDGTCTYVSGCTDSAANNYNPSAVTDDGSCTYDDPTGCTDSNATNYDPAAVVDDGNCTYPDANMLEFVWTNGGGSWDSEASWAMADSSGTTVADSTVDLSLAAAYYGDDCYTLTGFDAWGDGWEGSSVSVVDGAGTTVVSLSVASQGLSSTLISETVFVDVGASCVSGCTDSAANNYNASADIDDGSCTYDDPTGCTDSNATNYDPAAVVDDGTCTYPVTQIEFVWTNGGGSWDSEAAWTMDNSDGVRVADSSAGLNVGPADYQDGCYLLTGFDTWGDGWEGSSVSVVDGAGTTVVSLSVANQGLSNTLISETTYVGVGVACSLGCMDNTANNYDSSANYDDGSCSYPTSGPYDIDYVGDGSSGWPCWGEEVSWSLEDASGTTVADSTAGLSVADVALADGCYTFIMNDAYGDGWSCPAGDGAHLAVTDDTGLEFARIAGPTGSSSSATLGVNTVCP